MAIMTVGLAPGQAETVEIQKSFSRLVKYAQTPHGRCKILKYCGVGGGIISIVGLAAIAIKHLPASDQSGRIGIITGGSLFVMAVIVFALIWFNPCKAKHLNDRSRSLDCCSDQKVYTTVGSGMTAMDEDGIILEAETVEELPPVPKDIKGIPLGPIQDQVISVEPEPGTVGVGLEEIGTEEPAEQTDL